MLRTGRRRRHGRCTCRSCSLPGWIGKWRNARPRIPQSKATSPGPIGELRTSSSPHHLPPAPRPESASSGRGGMPQRGPLTCQHDRRALFCDCCTSSRHYRPTRRGSTTYLLSRRRVTACLSEAVCQQRSPRPAVHTRPEWPRRPRRREYQATALDAASGQWHAVFGDVAGRETSIVILSGKFAQGRPPVTEKGRDADKGESEKTRGDGNMRRLRCQR